MANIKQQKKRARQDARRRMQNRTFKSGMKTALKNVERAVDEGDRDKAEAALALAHKKLDKALVKGIRHKNYVARQKAHLQRKVNAM